MACFKRSIGNGAEFRGPYLSIKPKSVEAVRSVLVSALMIGAALSWRAITPVAVLVCGHFLIQVLNHFIKQKLNRNGVLLLLGLATPIAYLLVKIFGGDTKRGLSLENLKFYLLLQCFV
jgi:hypothetical protein